jgi:hypothetical protein
MVWLGAAYNIHMEMSSLNLEPETVSLNWTEPDSLLTGEPDTHKFRLQ